MRPPCRVKTELSGHFLYEIMNPKADPFKEPATKPGNDGAQLLIYDLIGAGVTVVPNPAGVTLYGQAAAPATAPQILIANPKANTVAAIGMDKNARQLGSVVVRIP
jgi:hypothetical protein